MKRNAIKRWVGACLLGSALATGCSQTGSRVDDRPPRVAHPYVPTKIDRPIMAQRQVDTLPTQLPMNPQPLQAQGPMNLPAPDNVPAAASDKGDMVKDASIFQTALDSSKMSSEPGSVRKGFADITAQPGFKHAEDYSWLSGQLQHSRKGWRLRYASVDEVDPYGGSVTLTTDELRLSGMKDGDLVRVHGRLLNPEDRVIAPPYEVTSIQAVEKRE